MKIGLVVVAGSAVACLVAAAPTCTAAPETSLVSVTSTGLQANFPSTSPAVVSEDGRFVAFESYASNLVPGDTNNRGDIFLRDRLLGTTVRLSVAPGGAEADGESFAPSISADGRYIAFASLATNLTTLDLNGKMDVFLFDRDTGVLACVSKSAAGSVGNNASTKPVLSADGRWVFFETLASNLVGGDFNNALDVYRASTASPATTLELVSRDSAGNPGGAGSGSISVSRDGRFLAFDSDALNLDIPDLNNRRDCFVRDLHTGVTTRVSKRADGVPAADASYTPAISDDGRWAAFQSFASNLVPGDTNLSADIFVKDLVTGALTRVNLGPALEQANFGSFNPRVSADGRFVVYASDATNLVPSDTNARTDVFVFDRQSGLTRRVSVSTEGAQGNNTARMPGISPDARHIVFEASSDNLVPGDTNTFGDIFHRAHPLCAADITGDAAVNTTDLAAMLGAFGVAVSPGRFGDFNADGVVNVADLTVLLADFGCAQ